MYVSHPAIDEQDAVVDGTAVFTWQLSCHYLLIPKNLMETARMAVQTLSQKPHFWSGEKWTIEG